MWDDHILVASHAPIRGIADVARLFTSHAFAGAGGLIGGERVVEYYRPIWTLSLGIDRALYGVQPWGYHLTSMLLHACACAAVVVFAHALLGGIAAPLIAGLLFAVHPVHVEAVAWVSARNELLATLFGVIALAAGLALQRVGAARSWLVCLGSGALALLSKETAVALPLLAAGLAALPDTAAPARRRVAWPAALAALAAVYVLVRAAMVHAAPEPHPLLVRLLSAPRLIARSVELLFVPIQLRVFHDVPVVQSAAEPTFWVPLVLMAGWIAIAAWTWRRQPVIALGMAWVVIALLPVAGIVATLQPAPVAERYLYLASVGAMLVLAGLVAIAERRPRARVAARWIAAIVILAFADTTMHQSRVWANDVTLMTRMVHDAPNVATGHANLAVALERRGHHDEALVEARRAIELRPNDALQHANAAVVYGKLGRLADAEREFRTALALAPGDPDSRYGLGWLYQKEERWDAAREQLEAAIRIRPDHAPSHATLGTVLLNLERGDAAVREFRTAIALDPALAEARFGLGLALGQSGRAADAVEEFRRAVALRPGWAEAHFDLGAIYAQLGRIPEARAELDSAARLAASDPTLRANAEAALEQLDRAR